jgi:ketosteroid isomerase-like protein
MAAEPCSAANTVGVLLKAVDMYDLDTIGALTAPDVHFRFGNADPTDTRSELVAAAQSFRAAIAGIHHEFVDIWEIRSGTVVAILDVHYRRLDGCELNLPCCNVFRVSDGLVRDYRLYMDVHPVSRREVLNRPADERGIHAQQRSAPRQRGRADRNRVGREPTADTNGACRRILPDVRVDRKGDVSLAISVA